MTTAAGYNDFNVAIGVGKPEGFTVIPVNGLGQVSQYNLPYLVGVSDKFAGMKILTNDITIINSPQNVLINANGTLEMYGTRISMLGEIFTNGSLVVKAPKFFTTTRTDTFNGVSCLAYDIDLSLYTNKPTINGFAHRRFRINFTHSNGRLDFQFAPKTFYVSLSTYNTLSCHSTDDLYGVSQLDIVGLQYCLFRNTIDKITFIAPTSLYGTTNITMYFVIEDLFSG